MTQGQMLYLMLVIVAFVIFAGALMRVMLLTRDAKPAGPQDTNAHYRATTQQRSAG